MRPLPGTGREEIARIAERLGLAGMLDDRPARLSGGQAHRVALGRLLASRCDALLLDEPYTGLDAGLRRDLTELVREQVAARQVPSVLVAHELDAAQAFADRMAVLDRGQILQTGPPAEVVAAPAARRVAELVGYRSVRARCRRAFAGERSRACTRTGWWRAGSPAGAWCWPARCGPAARPGPAGRPASRRPGRWCRSGCPSSPPPGRTSSSRCWTRPVSVRTGPGSAAPRRCQRERAGPAGPGPAHGPARPEPGGARLRVLRQARGYSQQQLAGMAGVSRQAVSAVEAGHSDPSLRVALALASALGVTVEELFGPGVPAPVVGARPVAPLGEEGARVTLAQVGDSFVALPLAADSAIRAGFLPAGGLVAMPSGPAPATPVRPLGPPRPTLVVAGCDPALPLLETPLALLDPPSRSAGGRAAAARRSGWPRPGWSTRRARTCGVIPARTTPGKSWLRGTWPRAARRWSGSRPGGRAWCCGRTWPAASAGSVTWPSAGCGW